MLSQKRDLEEFVPPTAAVDVGWFLIAGVLVFFMQSGFALLESGSVRFKNYQNILLKNCMDACIGGLVWWAWGFGFAFGNVPEEENNGFIGLDYIFGQNLKKDYQYHVWLFQFAFACTAATIVSGSLAERININAYLFLSFFITGFIYPVIVHWTWGEGWLFKMGYYDFAGSGIVHLTGGMIGITAAAILGPRLGRFKDIRADGDLAPKKDEKVGKTDKEKQTSSNKVTSYSDIIKKFHAREIHMNDVNSFVRKYQQKLEESTFAAHSPQQTVLGTLILWLGWLMFNGGSSLALTSTGAGDASLAMVNSILAPAAGGITTFFTRKLITGQKKDIRMDFQALTNGILAGLVSITAGCAAVETWAAIVIGCIGSVTYSLACNFMDKFQIDDPLEAYQVHGACGIWGVLACAFFHIDKGIVYGAEDCAKYLGIQIVGIIAITAWSVLWSAVFCLIAKQFGFLRLSEEDEIIGGDIHYFGPIQYKSDIDEDLNHSLMNLNKPAPVKALKLADINIINEDIEMVNGTAFGNDQKIEAEE